MRRPKSKKVKGNRAVAYIRVSDESQIQGYSLDAQRAEVARWCERNGYELVLVYADEGVSAHTDNIEKRPQLLKLLEDARQEKFDIVVVHTLDRWARNIGVQRLALKKLGECEVGFTSATEDFDYSSPNGSFLLTMLGGAAELFSDQLGVHVKKAQRQRAELGLPVGPVPFAYRTMSPGGVPQVVAAEAEAVLEVFERRARGDSNGSIATWLNMGFKTRKGRIFTAHAIKDLIDCRFYLGKVCCNSEEYQGQHEAIITEKLFQQARARKTKRDITRTVAGPKGLLQGLIACGRCGQRVQSDRHRYGGPMYRERHSHECTTNNRSMMAQKVDQQIQSILTSIELLPEWGVEMSRLAVTENEGPDPQELQEKRRRISRAYAEGAFSDAEYDAKLAEIDSQLRMKIPMELPALEQAAQLFEEIPQLWEEATPEEKRKLFSPLVERVYVDMEYSLIGAVVPVPAFRQLLEGGVTRAESSAAILLSEDEAERLKVWSWWRRGREPVSLIQANAVHVRQNS